MYAPLVSLRRDILPAFGTRETGAHPVPAWFLENKTKSMDDLRNPPPPAVAPTVVFLALIVFQPDLGTALACAGITACMLFVAVIRLRYFGYAFAAAIVPLYFLIFHVAYRKDRILATEKLRTDTTSGQRAQ